MTFNPIVFKRAERKAAADGKIGPRNKQKEKQRGEGVSKMASRVVVI